MSTKRGLALLLTLLGLTILVLAVPALAQEDSDETEPVPINADMEPAVSVTTPPAADATLDWTYRYMIPLGIVMAAVVVVITSIQYFAQVVRKRYRIVEE
jgi:phosphatidylglycerophosphate synthase